MTYFAFTIPESVRETLKETFPPKFPDVIGHHVTLAFSNRLPDGFTLGETYEITVNGYAHDASLEALVVSVEGEAKRPDGKVFHCTWSLDRAEGRKPVDSNAVIAAGKVALLDPPHFVFRAKLEQH